MSDRWELLGVEWGWPFSDDSMWHARRLDAERTLCGLAVDYTGKRPSSGKAGFFPVAQKLDPQPRCNRCDKAVEALSELGAAGAGVDGPAGVCPVCGQVASLQDGRISAHGGCAGVNMPPEQVKP